MSAENKPLCFGQHTVLEREHIRRDCAHCHVVGGCLLVSYVPVSKPGDVIILDSPAEAGARASDRQVAGSHYKEMGIQVWDVIDTWPYEQRVGFYRGNALKYIMRMGSKDAHLQEIKKAGHYIEKLTEVIAGEEAKSNTRREDF